MTKRDDVIVVSLDRDAAIAAALMLLDCRDVRVTQVADALLAAARPGPDRINIDGRHDSRTDAIVGHVSDLRATATRLSVTERRSKLPPLVVDGVDINEVCHRMVEQALVEIETMKASVNKLRALTKSLKIVVGAGAQLPADRIDQITAEMDDLLVELSKRDEA